jgi:hypothetical protein
MTTSAPQLALIFTPICIAGYIAVVAVALRYSNQSVVVMVAPAAALGILFAIGIVGLCVGAVFGNEALADLDKPTHGAE